MANSINLLQGDCIDRLKALSDESIDSIVTDPPYGLSDHGEKEIIQCMQAWLAGEEFKTDKKGFMGKTWDSFVPGPEVWKECFRVLKPGGYILAFASTRTDDLMSMAMRLAGFRKHPFIGWVFGSGFPKSTSLSKQFDKVAGVEREVIGVKPGHEEFANRHTTGHLNGADKNEGWMRPWMDDQEKRTAYHMLTAPTTDLAKEWDGWYYGLQSLKPAIEPCLMFQKPHEGRMTDNVERYGTGAINVDGCRVDLKDGDTKQATAGRRIVDEDGGWGVGESACSYIKGTGAVYTNVGRFPANLILDGSQTVTNLFPDSNGAGGSLPNVKVTGYGDGIGTGDAEYFGGERIPVDSGSGSAARFFKQCMFDEGDVDQIYYCPKASNADRSSGLDGFEDKPSPFGGDRSNGSGLGLSTHKLGGPKKNSHPTVKPCSLMRYLIRLVTPPGGTVLDPFMGSGSTGKAAMLEGFDFVGIELDPAYFEIATARIEHVRDFKDCYSDSGKIVKEPVTVLESTSLEAFFV